MKTQRRYRGRARGYFYSSTRYAVDGYREISMVLVKEDAWRG